MSNLLVISSAPAATIGAFHTKLDVKFVEGMRLYSDLWDGPVSCILKARDGDVIPFAGTYEANELPFDVTLLPAGRTISAMDLTGYDVILCDGDTPEFLHLAETCSRSGQRLFFTIENIVSTRIKILLLDRSINIVRKIYSFLTTLRQEGLRRRSFRLAAGLQANGYPAFATYAPLNPGTILYFDNRISEDLIATDEEMELRHVRRLSGARLRLMHSGRLEPLKGSQDLVPIAQQLASRGVDFELNIFGSGSLETEIRTRIVSAGLEDQVKLHGPVEFASKLVPFAREHADIYLACQRQSDPSCTYIESMACGLAIIGYANRMWSSLHQASGAGWIAPMGSYEAIADSVAQAAQSPERLSSCCMAARTFAMSHSAEREFQRRVDHLAAPTN